MKITNFHCNVGFPEVGWNMLKAKHILYLTQPRLGGNLSRSKHHPIQSFGIHLFASQNLQDHKPQNIPTILIPAQKSSSRLFFFCRQNRGMPKYCHCLTVFNVHCQSQMPCDLILSWKKEILPKIISDQSLPIQSWPTLW